MDDEQNLKVAVLTEPSFAFSPTVQSVINMGYKLVRGAQAETLHTAVTAVLEHARQNDGKIKRLDICGHGTPGNQKFGPGGYGKRIRWHGRQRRLLGRANLRRLQNKFADKGLMVLHGCNVGDGWLGLALLRSIAQLLEIKVVAGTGTQGRNFQNTMRLENTAVIVSPNGSFTRQALATMFTKEQGFHSRN